MRILVGDAETNGLKPTAFWCVVLKEYLKEEYHVFINDHHIHSCRDLTVLSQLASSTVSPLSEFPKFLKEHTKPYAQTRLVFHNGIDYDFHWAKQLLGVDVFDLGYDIRDTYVLSRLACPKRNGGHSVENWGVKFGIKKPEIDNNQWETFDPIMIHRCIEDVRIQEKIYAHLRDTELRGFSSRSVAIEHEAQRIISGQQRAGVYVDMQRVHRLFLDTKSRADSIERSVREVFPPLPVLLREVHPKETKDGSWAKNTLCGFDPSIVGGSFSRIVFSEFNLDSPAQRVQRLLKLGWEPTERTKPSKSHPNGQPKFTEDSLKLLPQDAPGEIKLLGEYLMTRSRQRLAEQLLDGTGTDGYIHPWINILGAGTHRMSHSNPNSANIPGIDEPYGIECRAVFTVENPELYCLVDADATGIQLRALAHYGGDPEYIRIVSDPGMDIHQVHSDVLQCTRAVAKTFIYAFLMGAGARKLIWVLGGSDIDKGKALLKQFYLRFPFLQELKERLDFEAERGYHVALDGRLIELDPEYPHKAMGVWLQSFEAIVMKRAMALYHADMIARGLKFWQRLIVHDEFLSETRKETACILGESMVQSIVDAGIDLGSKCPLTGKYLVGKTWAEVH